MVHATEFALKKREDYCPHRLQVEDICFADYESTFDCFFLKRFANT